MKKTLVTLFSMLVTGTVLAAGMRTESISASAVGTTPTTNSASFRGLIDYVLITPPAGTVTGVVSLVTGDGVTLLNLTNTVKTAYPIRVNPVTTAGASVTSNFVMVGIVDTITMIVTQTSATTGTWTGKVIGHE